MEKGRRDTVLLTVIGIATLLVAIVGATFAFFTARVFDNETASTVTIRSSAGSTVVFSGGLDPITVQNIYPRGTDDANPWAVKSFKVHYTNDNTGYLYTYKLKLNYTNSFGAGEIRYDLIQTDGYCPNKMAATSSDCGTGWEAYATQDGTRVSVQDGTLNNVGTTVTEIDLGNGTFPAGSTDVTHTYALKISYPDSGSNQNYTNQISERTNQGQSLTAWVSIDEIVNNTNS